MRDGDEGKPVNDDLAASIDLAAHLTGQRVDGARLGEIDRIAAGRAAPQRFVEAWLRLELAGEPRPLSRPGAADLPCVCWSAEKGWLVVRQQRADGSWQCEGSDGQAMSLDSLDGMDCLALPRRQEQATSAPSAISQVWSAMLARKRIFLEAVVATGLVNLLTLAASIYSMQVYDRVIPNHGFQTLWVLTVGVALALSLELLLKHARARGVDRACQAIDRELSESLFQRMLGVRMESRPASVGTLASQVKGFEMIRGVLASTSLFVLADVPFALFFVLIIFLVGGGVAAVPLAALPVALIAGVLFQRAIQRHTRNNLGVSNRKAGLLVEAVDGAESLKAGNGEWTMRGRWRGLVEESSEAEQRIRDLSTVSQNFTVFFQQLSYVALVAVGAYFVAENALTMGGLLACSIISNRAMMPIVQLPGVMVQWAHARAAIDGLDRVIDLPNEADMRDRALVPRVLSGELRLERVRFAYGAARHLALEVDRLEIKPGDRLGLLGPIGSGKSTLLKLASGLYRPSEGKVFLGGIDMALLAPEVLREMVGYLPQDVRLFSGTLRDNLVMGMADPGDEAILSAARRTGLLELITAQSRGLGLEISEGGRGVSGGQKMLIALTRLLLAKPAIWLLDEPTGAMDSVAEQRIVNLLREVASEGCTVVVATHKTALLPLLDHLVVLQGGRVVMDGARESVMAKLSGRNASANTLGKP